MVFPAVFRPYHIEMSNSLLLFFCGYTLIKGKILKCFLLSIFSNIFAIVDSALSQTALSFDSDTIRTFYKDRRHIIKR